MLRIIYFFFFFSFWGYFEKQYSNYIFVKKRGGISIYPPIDSKLKNHDCGCGSFFSFFFLVGCCSVTMSGSVGCGTECMGGKGGRKRSLKKGVMK